MRLLHPFSLRMAPGRALAVILLLCISSISHAFAQGLPKENPEGTIRQRDEEYRESLERTKEEGMEEDVRGRDEWFMFQRRFPYDVIPAGAHAAAIRETRSMEDRLQSSFGKKGLPSLLSTTQWESIGPINVGGRIPAVAYHPTKTGTFLIGTASG
ncbi:MAG: hypothetical protein ABIR47_04050, partial [Candidatus Kapaibacterium sp.]